MDTPLGPPPVRTLEAHAPLRLQRGLLRAGLRRRAHLQTEARVTAPSLATLLF